jgi:mono/diheme cytochrome c family protein
MQRKNASRFDNLSRHSVRRQCLVWGPVVLGLLFAVGVAGCGVNASQLLFSAADATGNTLLDIWLTEFANDVVGAGQEEANENTNENANENENGNANENTNTNENTNGNDNGGESPGATLFADHCASCHGADGTGGFGPDITGDSAAEISSALSSISVHSSISLTEAEIADIATFLGG